MWPARPAFGGDAMKSPGVTPREPAFEQFFRDAYQPLLRDIMFIAGNLHEAEDAVCSAMAEVLQRWETIENPRAYARRAAISNLIKARQRGQTRIRERMIARGDVLPDHDPDAGLTAWEEQEWVLLLLKSLPQAQREVLACIVDMFPQREIAQLLGKSEAAIRQNLRAARKRLRSHLAETMPGGRPGERQR
jgi:RNA polymerase sigma factor (sigma-70 family)